MKTFLTILILSLIPTNSTLWFKQDAKNLYKICSKEELQNDLKKCWNQSKWNDDNTQKTILATLRFIMLARKETKSNQLIFSNKISEWEEILPKGVFENANEKEKKEIFEACHLLATIFDSYNDEEIDSWLFTSLKAYLDNVTQQTNIENRLVILKKLINQKTRNNLTKNPKELMPQPVTTKRYNYQSNNYAWDYYPSFNTHFYTQSWSSNNNNYIDVSPKKTEYFYKFYQYSHLSHQEKRSLEKVHTILENYFSIYRPRVFFCEDLKDHSSLLSFILLNLDYINNTQNFKKIIAKINFYQADLFQLTFYVDLILRQNNKELILIYFPETEEEHLKIKRKLKIKAFECFKKIEPASAQKYYERVRNTKEDPYYTESQDTNTNIRQNTESQDTNTNIRQNTESQDTNTNIRQNLHNSPLPKESQTMKTPSSQSTNDSIYCLIGGIIIVIVIVMATAGIIDGLTTTNPI